MVVKKAPKKVTEDDLCGYLFAHFIGEQEGDQEQIYFALSDEGLHFNDMNNGKHKEQDEEENSQTYVAQDEQEPELQEVEKLYRQHSGSVDLVV